MPKLMEGLKVWFAIFIMALVILTGVAVYQDLFPEYAKYQKEFYKREMLRGANVTPSIDLKHLWLPELKHNGYNRCIS